MSEFLHKYKFELLLALFITVYIAYFSVFTILRYRTLHANYYDLGIMDQTVYNTSRGRILELTNPDGADTIKRMAIHNDVLLAALAPLYWIHAGPETLLFAQTIVLALGAVFLYLITRKILRLGSGRGSGVARLKRPRSGSAYLPITLSFAYLMYPPLQWSNTYDFHIVTFATTLLLATFYFLLKKKYTTTLVCFFLVLLAKEQIALVTACIGLLLIIKPQTVFGTKKEQEMIRKIGLIFLIVSIFWFIISIWYIIPFFRQSDHFALSRYNQFGDTPHSVIKGIIAKPLTVFQLFTDPSTLLYIISLFGPLIFLSFFSPLILTTIPEFAINVLSNNINMREIIFHYTAVITPIVFISAIYGVIYVMRKYGITYKKISIVQLIVTLGFSYYMSPLPYSKQFDGRTFFEKKIEVSNVDMWSRKLADENIKVAASLGLATKFTERKTIIRFSAAYKKADYVVLLKKEISGDWYDPAGTWSAYQNLLMDKSFEKVFEQGDLIVYKKI